MKINLGCGTKTPEGWVNVDYALGARFVKLPLFRSLNEKLNLFNIDYHQEIFLHDLTKAFPWKDSTADVIYSSHTLEHLSKQEGERFLQESHRVLRENGVIRIVVPDLQTNVSEYLEGKVLADDFVEKLGVLYGRNKNPIKARLAPFFQFPHKCMYDAPRLLEILRDIGFKASAKSAFDSDIEDIAEIELEDRTKAAVIAEGKKC